MTSSVLTKVDPEFGALQRHREALKEEAAKKREELLKVPVHAHEKQAEISSRLREISAELQLSQGSFDIARRRAKAAAGERLIGDGKYKKLVSEAAISWATRLAPEAALAQVQQEARRAGVEIPCALPPIVANEIAVAVAWLQVCVKRELVDAKDLPPALRPLLEEAK